QHASRHRPLSRFLLRPIGRAHRVHPPRDLATKVLPGPLRVRIDHTAGPERRQHHPGRHHTRAHRARLVVTRPRDDRNPRGHTERRRPARGPHPPGPPGPPRPHPPLPAPRPPPIPAPPGRAPDRRRRAPPPS